MKKYLRSVFSISMALVALAASPSPTYATHAWSTYHWARTANPFTLKLGDLTSGTWTGLLTTASADWSLSTVLDTTMVTATGRARTCRAVDGRVVVCNWNYGRTGYLGIAQIWLDNTGHIYKGIVKNNDYYFSTSYPQYNNESNKLHTMCQEVGHTFGLDHQSTDGTSLDTCMDYYTNTSNADTVSTYPNQHDYDQLETIYTHLDATSSATNSVPQAGITNDPSQWGRLKLVRRSGQGVSSTYERDLGAGQKVVTLVIWAR